MLVLLEVESFSKDVHRRGNMVNSDLVRVESVSDDVVPNLDLFYPLVICGIFRDIESTVIIREQCGRRNFEGEFGIELRSRNGFTGCI